MTVFLTFLLLLTLCLSPFVRSADTAGSGQPSEPKTPPYSKKLKNLKIEPPILKIRPGDTSRIPAVIENQDDNFARIQIPDSFTVFGEKSGEEVLVEINEPEAAENLEKLPEGIKFPDSLPESLKGRISHDAAKKLLVLKGFMKKEERDALLNLSKGNTPEDSRYKEAVEKLFQNSQKKWTMDLGPREKGYFFVSVDKKEAEKVDNDTFKGNLIVENVENPDDKRGIEIRLQSRYHKELWQLGALFGLIFAGAGMSLLLGRFLPAMSNRASNFKEIRDLFSRLNSIKTEFYALEIQDRLKALLYEARQWNDFWFFSGSALEKNEKVIERIKEIRGKLGLLEKIQDMYTIIEKTDFIPPSAEKRVTDQLEWAIYYLWVGDTGSTQKAYDTVLETFSKGAVSDYAVELSKKIETRFPEISESFKEKPPKGFPPPSLKDKISYDADRLLLIFKGVMTPDEKKTLLQLKEPPKGQQKEQDDVQPKGQQEEASWWEWIVERLKAWLRLKEPSFCCPFAGQPKREQEEASYEEVIERLFELSRRNLKLKEVDELVELQNYKEQIAISLNKLNAYLKMFPDDTNYVMNADALYLKLELIEKFETLCQRFAKEEKEKWPVKFLNLLQDDKLPEAVDFVKGIAAGGVTVNKIKKLLEERKYHIEWEPLCPVARTLTTFRAVLEDSTCDNSVLMDKFDFIWTIRSPLSKFFKTYERLETPPPKGFPPASLEDKISYAPKKQLLIFRGVMKEAERAELTRLSEEAPYQEAIKRLFQKSRMGHMVEYRYKGKEVMHIFKEPGTNYEVNVKAYIRDADPSEPRPKQESQQQGETKEKKKREFRPVISETTNRLVRVENPPKLSQALLWIDLGSWAGTFLIAGASSYMAWKAELSNLPTWTALFTAFWWGFGLSQGQIRFLDAFKGVGGRLEKLTAAPKSEK
ncbi:MAG TPA: hypothetical protein ACFYD3_06545 [Candidatus Hypogeohydataceae bacterium YC41]